MITEATLEVRTARRRVEAGLARSSVSTDATTGPGEGDGDIFAEGRAYVAAYEAEIAVPDTGGWVDLRVTATDAAGNTFSQEIERAFEAAPAKGAGHGGGSWQGGASWWHGGRP